MDISNITKIKIEIIINKSLFNKNIIDEETYSKVNEKLIRLLKSS